MTRPKSERRCFGALLERVFRIWLGLSKGMLFDASSCHSLGASALVHKTIRFVRNDVNATFSAFHMADVTADPLLCRVKPAGKQSNYTPCILGTI